MKKLIESRNAFLWFKSRPSDLLREISVESSAGFSELIGGDLRRFGWIIGVSELEMRNALKSFLREVIWFSWSCRNLARISLLSSDSMNLVYITPEWSSFLKPIISSAKI